MSIPLIPTEVIRRALRDVIAEMDKNPARPCPPPRAYLDAQGEPMLLEVVEVMSPYAPSDRPRPTHLWLVRDHQRQDERDGGYKACCVSKDAADAVMRLMRER